MEFSFSEEQDELRRTARRFLEVASSTERVRAAMETERGYDPEVWEQLAAELGWTALTIPEEYGGLGMSYLDLHPLMEEMGRALLCSPFFSTICLGANALLLGGSEEHKEKYLAEIAAGDLTATLAFTEPNGLWDANGIEATYEKDGNELVLTGKKHYVVDGHTADLLIIAARSAGSRGSEGVSLFLVPGDSQGLVRTWLPTVDQTRRLASLSLEGLRLPNSALLGTEGQGWRVCERVLDLANTALAAEQVGGAEACLDMAVEYAKVRKQFGRPIGSFQAIKVRRLLCERARGTGAPTSSRSRCCGKGLLLRCVLPVRGRQPPSARRHRLHVGGRRTPVLEARQGIRGALRRRDLSPRSPCRHRGALNGTASDQRRRGVSRRSARMVEEPTRRSLQGPEGPRRIR